MEQNGGKAPNMTFMIFCHPELTHAQWKILLDDDFIEAWQHGIVVTCDGILASATVLCPKYHVLRAAPVRTDVPL
jgi:hypothetical protein